ncbi:hypothetical protein HYC85_000098 [Camellia sinensis]|uniref:At2g24240-like C-terminal beta-propeller domain-containing protein n=1 Tax=Camellia sinensis TaxID=4442 RepID=A0A7J7FPD1_CAMSI|nr:hypothetical protein HYC85_000098 [Camellia sinensis]
MAIHNNILVKFNVGGNIFKTTISTLANAGHNSFFGKIEALLYGLLDNVRSAKCGQFDGSRLQFSHSLTGQAPSDGTAIRGSPNGGCCVVHDSMVHVYDWMLEEHPPINLDYQRVYDIGWVDSETIVVSAGGGGMGLFSAATGKLRHRFQVTNEDHQVKSYTAGALSFNSDYKIFSSCKGENNKEYGIGVWDQLTGKQIEFYYDQYGWSLGEANRLQWLHDDEDDNPTTQWQFRDAIAMEETNSTCLVNECGDFGFLNLRSIDMIVRWCLNNSTMKFKMKEPCYPKLAFHNGQLFLSMNHSVSVYCGPDWVLTSRLGRSNAGSICDFSIGGDRLFALHYEQNVFDIWETPQKPIR